MEFDTTKFPKIEQCLIGQPINELDLDIKSSEVVREVSQNFELLLLDNPFICKN